MKIIVNRDLFLAVAECAMPLTARKTGISTTECLLLTSKDGEVSLRATDINTSYFGKIKAEVIADGAIMPMAKKFIGMLKAMSTDTVTIELCEGRLCRTTSGKVVFDLYCQHHDDFPDVPIPECEFFEVEGFKNMLATNVPFFESGDKRAHIAGFLLKRDGNQFVSVSTDNRRVHIFAQYANFNEAMLDGSMFIVPKSAIPVINRFIKYEDTVQIGFTDRHLVLKIVGDMLYVSLLEGQFPAYKQALAYNDDQKFTVNKHEIIDVLKRMAVLYSEDNKNVILSFKPGVLKFHSFDAIYGEISEEIGIDFKKEMQLSFNPNYIIDAIGLTKRDYVDLYVSQGERPLFVIEDDYIALIMPIKLNKE